MVSVLIPVYNCEKYLSEAIESVLNQTYKNFEIIIVDDGSTDSSLDIARKYESDKVKVFSQPHSGAPRARNLAFEKSAGEFIQYLDADDMLAPNKIENQLHKLTEQKSDCLVFCSYTHNLSDFNNRKYLNQEINKDYLYPVDLYVDILNLKGNILTTSWLFPREVIKCSYPWNERLIKAQDIAFVIGKALKSKSIIFSEHTLVLYRITGSNLTRKQDISTLKSVMESTEFVENEILRYETSDRVIKALAKYYSHLYCAYYGKVNRKQLDMIRNKIHAIDGELCFIGNKQLESLSKIIGTELILKLKTMFHL